MTQDQANLMKASGWLNLKVIQHYILFLPVADVFFILHTHWKTKI